MYFSYHTDVCIDCASYEIPFIFHQCSPKTSGTTSTKMRNSSLLSNTPTSQYAFHHRCYRICFLSISIGYSINMLLSLLYSDDVRNILMCFICGNQQITRRRRINYTTHLTMRPMKKHITTQV
jgi:hypothetical protein